MTRYAIIDNASGYIFGVTDADTPEQAAAQINADITNDVIVYERTSGPAFSNESGYHIYEAPANFEVNDGQDQDEINAVSSLPRVAYLRVVSTDGE